MMLFLTASLLVAVSAFPFEITPQPVFPVPDPTPAEPCGIAARACIAGADCASGFCNIAPGAPTGCCQDTQWPEPGADPTPAPFEPACPASIPMCISDIDCGFTGYCNHTEARHNFFGCCQFGSNGGSGTSDGPAPFPFPFPTDSPFPNPGEGPGPFPFPVSVPTPAEAICPPFINLCIADADCSPGDSCSHSASNSDVFGCCHAGMVDPVPFPFPGEGPFPNPGEGPGPFPFPVSIAPPAEAICPPSINLCIADADCSPGDSCSHSASNSDVFGCCHAGMVDPAPFPFPPLPFSEGPGLFPFPDPAVPTQAPAQICPASVALCIADAECGEGQACSHTASNSDVFGCCHPSDGGELAPFTSPPFVPVEEQRCAAELSCLADADCFAKEGRCEFVFGSPMGCCTPNLL